MRQRSDRAAIADEWIERVIASPLSRVVQPDGRIRLWARISEMDNRFLRVILLDDGKLFTTHFLTADLRPMKAKYFPDTDTLYFELRATEVTDTRDLDDDTILDYDVQGNVVGITLEHAKSKVGGEKVEFEMVLA